MGKHADAINKQNQHLSAEQIKAAKCARRKQQHLTEKEESIAENKARLKEWRNLTPQQQIKSLESRRGESKKQIAKIKEKIRLLSEK